MAAVVFTCLCLLASPAQAQDLPLAPADRVLDRSGVLSGDQEREVVALIDALEAETGAEVGVLVTPTAGGESSQAYALRVFNHWGVGKAAEDNGVLLVLLTQDRRVEITPGDGYQDLFTRRRCETLLQRYVVPQLKAGQPGQAVIDAVQEIADAVRMHEQGLTPSSLESSGSTSHAPAPPVHDSNSRTHTTPHRSSGGGAGLLLVPALLLGVPGVIGLVILLWPKCPRCKTRLSSYSRTINAATYSRAGRGERTYRCKQCGYSRRESYRIPRKTHTQTTSFGGSSGFGSSGGSSFGGGGSSFGGGSSSGGGGGASW